VYSNGRHPFTLARLASRHLPSATEWRNEIYGHINCERENNDCAREHTQHTLDLKESYPKQIIASSAFLFQVLALIRKYNRTDRTIVGAFSDWTAHEIQERGPDINRIFSGWESVKIYLLYFVGTLQITCKHD
jgi:hypothetical protein